MGYDRFHERKDLYLAQIQRAVEYLNEYQLRYPVSDFLGNLVFQKLAESRSALRYDALLSPDEVNWARG